ncbi:MAG: 4-(cytidine 5'-diphospho)-2-C-methyl-D-erythritol kinase [Magnetococcales bacterium]|nr:4-(cytidine 5'-diphospho)-2-C-methyl-D-erythritol kinase [Magnetococcales bacterium]
MNRFLAPAKVNLFLHVMGRRDDGYHLLRTVMTFFPLYDILEMDVGGNEVTLACHPPVTGNPEQNLVVRAARLLQKNCNCRQGVHISLTKNIPAAAGLGGGSSDAATTLMALNRLWSLGLSQTELAEIGLTLGADVPLFIGQKTALAEGIGEQLTPMETLPTFPLLLINPGVPVSTPAAFSGLNGRWPERDANWSLAEGLQENDALTWMENDLESPARCLAPEIDTVFQALHQQGARMVRMSGSGASVFGVFESDNQLIFAAESIKSQYNNWLVFSGRTFHIHPFASG